VPVVIEIPVGRQPKYQIEPPNWPNPARLLARRGTSISTQIAVNRAEFDDDGKCPVDRLDQGRPRSLDRADHRISRQRPQVAREGSPKRAAAVAWAMRDPTS
jgi:hypothetical protein